MENDRNDTSVTFFVRDHDTAQELRNLSRKIPHPSNNDNAVRQNTLVTNRVKIDVFKCFKMFLSLHFQTLTIFVRPVDSPSFREITPEHIEKLKVAMSNRYAPPTQSLDLSDFHNDTGKSYFLDMTIEWSRLSIFYIVFVVLITDLNREGLYFMISPLQRNEGSFVHYWEEHSRGLWIVEEKSAFLS